MNTDGKFTANLVGSWRDLPTVQLGGDDLVFVEIRKGVRQKMHRAEAIAKGLLAADAKKQPDAPNKARPPAPNKMRDKAANKAKG